MSDLASLVLSMIRFEPPQKEETGICDSVEVKEIAGKKLTFFAQDKQSSAVSTLIIRGATNNVLEDIERAVGTSSRDLLCIYSSLCRRVESFNLTFSIFVARV